MSNTIRRRASALRHTRASYIHRCVSRALLSALAYDRVHLRRSETERRAQRDAAWEAYTAAWIAWNTTQLGDPPYRPWPPSKYHSVPATESALATLVATETMRAGQFWDRMTRDGGRAKTANWDWWGRVPRKTQRRHRRLACAAYVKDPDAWLDGTLHGPEYQPDTFPDLI